jgi:SAM-dependent methyltransferase
MDYTVEEATHILKFIERNHPQDEPANITVKRTWLMLLHTRLLFLTTLLRPLFCDTTQSGPFKGMRLTDDAITNFRMPILIGCYEHELHPSIEKIIAEPYTRILNIGCAVGFYAIGFALRMPNIQIDAFDISTSAQTKCATMAALNGVQDRIKIGGEFYGEDFAKYADEKVLAFVDIEGAELDLLNPSLYPSLHKMDILVELHDAFNPLISRTLCERFAPTHDIEIMPNRNNLPSVEGLVPPEVYLDPMDQLLLGWEERGGPTPWAFFRTKDQ